MSKLIIYSKFPFHIYYLKVLERFRNNPSLEVFKKFIHYFNLSTDTVIYPEQKLTEDTYRRISRLLTQCNEKQLKVIQATAEIVLPYCKNKTKMVLW